MRTVRTCFRVKSDTGDAEEPRGFVTQHPVLDCLARVTGLMLVSGGCVCCLRRLVTYWHLPVSGVRPGPGYITSHRSRSPSQHWERETGAGTGHLVTNIQGQWGACLDQLRMSIQCSSLVMMTLRVTVVMTVPHPWLRAWGHWERPHWCLDLVTPGTARPGPHHILIHLNTHHPSTPTTGIVSMFYCYLDMYHLYHLHTKNILVSPQYLRCFPLMRLKRIVEEKTNVMICLNWFCSPTFFLCLKFAPPQHQLSWTVSALMLLHTKCWVETRDCRNIPLIYSSSYFSCIL